MKILFLQDDFPPQSQGGAGYSVYELATGMRRMGHDVSVITTCRKKEDAGEFEYVGLTVYRLVSNYPERWRAYVSLYNVPVVRQVENILRSVQPDAVHINNVHTHLSYHCFKLAKRYARTVIFTARDTMAFTYGKLDTSRYRKSFDTKTTWLDNLRQAKRRYNPLRNLIIRKYLSYADGIFAVSNALREAFVQNGIPNVSVVYTGADASAWQATEVEVNNFRKKFGLEKKSVIFYGARMSEGKGGGKTLDALASIVREIPDAVLALAGNADEYTESLKDFVNRAGIGNNVVFLGWIDRETMRVAYNASNVVLVPSLYLDPFPRAAIEAMAAGKPVVGTCFGGAPEIIADGVTGYVVNPLHPEEIARKVIDLLKEPAKARRFGAAGLERITKDFNLQKMLEKYLAIYKSL